MRPMSLRVEAIKGNIHKDEDLRKLHEELLRLGGVEKVAISRRDATKNRQRVTSDRGREVIIDIPRGIRIGNGDVLIRELGSLLVVELVPEETVVLTVENANDWKKQVERTARLGYLLGLKHFHPFIADNEIIVPVEEKSREEMPKVFGTFEGVSVRFEKRVLEESGEDPPFEHGT